MDTKVLGGGLAGLLVGSGVGALGAGTADVILNNGYDVGGAAAFGGKFGAAAGLLSGAIIAQVTDSKLESGIYGTLAGAVLGGAAGAVAEPSLYAIGMGAIFGAVTGGTSGVAVSHFMGH